MKLKYQIFWLIVGLIALYAVPLTLYYIHVSDATVSLGLDPSIEASLRKSLEYSSAPEEKAALDKV